MTNDDRPSRPDTGMDPEQRAFYEFVLDAGRRDTAPEDLGARLLERIDHRSRIELYAAEARPRRRVLISAVCILLAAAAAALLVRRLKEPVSKIAAERPAASSGRPKTPVPDPCRSRISAPGGEPVIDDFEDGDDAIARLEQRVAFWRWAREIDAPGTAPALIPVPHPEATPDNRLAIHVKGGQLLDWGAAVEFTFRPACYDASGYAGIAFRARGPGRIYVAPREPAVIPIAEGGTASSIATTRMSSRWISTRPSEATTCVGSKCECAVSASRRSIPAASTVWPFSFGPKTLRTTCGSTTSASSVVSETFHRGPKFLRF